MKQYFKINQYSSFMDMIIQYQEHDEAVEYIYPSNDLIKAIKTDFNTLKIKAMKGLTDESAEEYFSDEDTFEAGYLDSIQSALNAADIAIQDISIDAEYRDKQKKLEYILNHLTSIVFFIEAYDQYLTNIKGVKDNG